MDVGFAKVVAVTMDLVFDNRFGDIDYPFHAYSRKPIR